MSAALRKGRVPVCLECGGDLPPSNKRPEFCCTDCRRNWNNRRQIRGAIIGDLFMALRFDRDTAKELGVWTLLTRLSKQFRDEDNLRRGGRRSWQPPQRVLESRPSLRAEILK